MLRLLLCLVPAAALVISSCAENSKKQEAAPPSAYDKTVSKMDANQEAYVVKTQSRIAELKSFGEQLRTKAAVATKPQGKKMSNAAEDLDSLIKDVTKQLADVSSASPTNWIDEKRDVDRALERAESKYSNSVPLLK
jgi:hypothetical protein